MYFFFFRFYLREIQSDVPWLHMYPYGYGMDSSILRNFIPLVLNSNNREYPDLCQLPGTFQWKTFINYFLCYL